MTLEVKKFLHSLKDKEDYQFLFYRFYYNPSLILRTLKSSTYRELINAPELKLFFSNNLLLEFLSFALADQDFVNTLDEHSIYILASFISESQKFVAEYEELKHDNICRAKHLEANFSVDAFDYSGSFFNLIYTEWKRKRLPQNIFQKVESFNMALANQIMDMLSELSACICNSKYNKAKRSFYLKKVFEEDYLSVRSYCLIDESSGEEDFGNDDFEWFYSFVCNNEFVDVAEKLFLEGRLSGLALGNAIDIIERGISIKTLSKPLTTLERRLLGEKLIALFNLERAKKVISRLASFEIYKKGKQPKPACLTLIKSSEINK